jgi:glycine/D-amino acid oxidase-like deaminating enzyme
MLDYLVVGLGLAGISFCETLDRHNRSFQVVNDSSQASSAVAGGLYNPVMLKRFTLVWNAAEQLQKALPFYAGLERKLGTKLNHPLPIFRRFSSVEEQNLWFEAADKEALKPFLSPRVHPRHHNPNIDAPFGYGEVLQTGRVDTQIMLTAYKDHLRQRGRLTFESFDHKLVQIEEGHVIYKTVKARHLVFTEGYGLSENPYFGYLPLTGTKGEYLIIEAPELKERNAIKAAIFIIPMGNDRYRVGATYKWKDKSNSPTEASKAELLEQLNQVLKCKYQVVGQEAGIRPTVTDRRPLVGRHPIYNNLYVLNGFGSRGVMIAPAASEQLFGLIENDLSLPPEMDIARFKKKYFPVRPSPLSGRNG